MEIIILTGIVRHHHHDVDFAAHGMQWSVVSCSTSCAVAFGCSGNVMLIHCVHYGELTSDTGTACPITLLRLGQAASCEPTSRLYS